MLYYMKEFICQVCNKECKTKSALYNHIKIHNLSVDKYKEKFNIISSEKICIQCGNNIPQTIYNENYHEITHKIISNTSHFNKKQRNKEEFIVKIKEK